MSRFSRACVALLALTLSGAPLVHAQSPLSADRDLPRVDPRPQTRTEARHAEALTLYSVGLLHERANRLVQAVKTLEEARDLDPDAAPIHKALVSLYLALDRDDAALAASQRILELTPGDAESWYLYARQLKAHDKTRASVAALIRGIACPCLRDMPELHMQMGFDLGVLCESIQEDDKALAAFKQVVNLLENPEPLIDEGTVTREEIDSQTCDLYERMAKLCLRGKKFDDATRYFAKARDKAQDTQPGRAKRICFNLALVLHAQGDFAGALKPLDEYLHSQPSDMEAYKVLIQILGALDRNKDVVPALEGYSRADANNESLKLLLAEELLKVKETKKAEDIYRDLAKNRSLPEAYKGLVQIAKTKGRSGAEAILTELDATLGSNRDQDGEIRPDADALHARALIAALREDSEMVGQLLPIAVSRLGSRDNSLKPSTRYFLAALAGRTKQLDNAEKLYRSCLDDLTQGNAPRAGEPEIYGGLLRVLWIGHKYAEIEKVCRSGLDKAQVTDRTMFQLDLARALMLQGKMKEAVAAANAAVDVSRAENLLLCRRSRAAILAQAEQYEPAIADCLAMLKESTKESDIREVRYTLSNVYSLAKQMAKSEEQLELILKSDPDDATACNDLGYLWADQNKNLPEAEKLIRKALDLERKQKTSSPLVSVDSDQDNAAYLDSLGWVLFRRGKLKEARELLEKASALDLGLDDPVVWDHLGDVYQRQHEPKRATAAWKKAIDLYNDAHRRPKDDRFKEIQQKLKLVEQQSHAH
jgi:tetratricopeptide (TPR) repeat protein